VSQPDLIEPEHAGYHGPSPVCGELDGRLPTGVNDSLFTLACPGSSKEKGARGRCRHPWSEGLLSKR
jgi:hypothetical protein